MKCLYITFSDPNAKAGLFISTHKRIKNSISSLDDYIVMNIRFYDNWLLRKIKLLLGLIPKNICDESFTFDEITYHNVWIKRGLFSSTSYLGKLDNLRKTKLFMREDFNYRNKLLKIFSVIDNYDYIMAHWGYPNGKIAEYISRKANRPFFVTYHGSDVNVIPKKSVVIKNSMYDMLKAADNNFFVSRALLNEAINIWGTINGTVLYNGIDDEIIIDDNKLLKNKEKTIIFIGNLNKDKRADKLGVIIKKIMSTSKLPELRFIIIGDGEFRTKLENELKFFSKNVLFLGHLPQQEVFSYLKKSNLLILPSRREGLPLVLLEALAARVLPVTSNVGGISEIIDKDYIVDADGDFETAFSERVCYHLNSSKQPKFDIKKITWSNISRQELELIKDKVKNND